MLFSKVRFWGLVAVLLVYIAGVLILSAMSLQESKNLGIKSYPDSNNQPVSKSKSFEYGLPGFRPPLRRSKINWCSELKYLDPPKDPVALASFPGSGNTWLRYLLQQATDWQQFVSDKLRGWRQMNLDWLYNFTGPTHVVFYEQLVDDVEHTLRTVLRFLEVPIDEEMFKCAIERREGIYRRKKRVLNFDPYNPRMKESLKSVQEKVYDAIYNFAAPASRRRR